MANGVRVELSESALAANPGGAVTTRCTIYNASLIVDEYRVTVSGVDPSWVEAPAATSRIFPEAFETVSVTFKPPRAAGVAAGDYPFTVTAASMDNPALTASANGTLTIDPFVDFGFDLDGPRQTSGEVEGTFGFRLTNTGNARLTIALDAKEETGQLEFSFPDQPVQVAAGATSTAKLIARPTAASLGRAAVYQITVGATIAEISPPQSIADELRRKTTLVTFQTVPGTADPPVLSPQSVELSGQRTQTELVLKNKSAIPLVMALAGSDKASALAFEFVGGDQVTVPPQGDLRVTIRITCLDQTKLAAPPAPTVFTITATPLQPSGDPRTVQGELTRPGPADFRLRLEPELVESTAVERVQLTIENVSPRAATFTIAATSKDAALAVTPSAERVEAGANDRVVVPIELAPKGDAAATGRPSGYSIRVAPADSPAHANEVSGQYLYSTASITARLIRKEIEAVAEATFDFEITNNGRGEVTVAVEASDRAGSCTYAFDLPRIRINGRSTAVARLTVTPPKDHRPDAKWEFEVLAKPVAPEGPAVKDAGVLIYRAATVTLALSPSERRGRRTKKYDIILSNPTSMPMKVKIGAVDRSGGMAIQLPRDTVDVPPSGRGSVKVPLKVKPWGRPRGSAPTALSFNVSATPISPPGDAVTTEGRIVALPPWPKWVYFVILAVAVLVLLSIPGPYTWAFYQAGWQKDDKLTPEWVREHPDSGHHTFWSDVKCTFRTAVDDGPGAIQDECFVQGPRPEGAGRGLQDLVDDE